MASSLQDERYRKIIDSIKKARLDAGLSQKEVADELGKPQSYIAKTERYERRLDILEFIELLSVLPGDLELASILKIP